jgi:hypothetical protein
VSSQLHAPAALTHGNQSPVGPRSGLLLLLRIVQPVTVPTELGPTDTPVHDAATVSRGRLFARVFCVPVTVSTRVEICYRFKCFESVGMTQTESVLRKASHQLRDPAVMAAI